MERLQQTDRRPAAVGALGMWREVAISGKGQEVNKDKRICLLFTGCKLYQKETLVQYLFTLK